MRPWLPVTALVCASAVLAGCGEKQEITSAPESTPAPGERSTAPRRGDNSEPRVTPPGDRPVENPPGRPRAGSARSPEDEPGGAGDEIPARAEAIITGRRGRLSPRKVRVPPFIAVRVVLRSGDGKAYQLSGAGMTLSAGGRRSDTATFDGLRPGRRLLMRSTGGRVVVEASAEPGP